MMKRWQKWTWAPMFCGALGLLGCSAGQPPRDSIATAEQAVRRAADAGATQYAPLEMRIAREKLDSAKRAVNSEKYDQARRLAEQSQADARLAEVKAGSERARQSADETRKSIDALRREAERPQSN